MSHKAGVYIHIPFCKARCNYCAFVSSVDFSLMRSYVAALCEEIRGFNTIDKSIDTVYIGGGTPSCLYRGALSEIFLALSDSFDFDECTEITVEANPESCDEAFLNEAVSCGVNRISIGLQSACDATLKNIGRLHSVSGFISAVNLVKKAGIDNISSDIILGLPGESEKGVENAIKLVSDYCEHISVYALTVEEGTELFRRGYKPDDDALADLYDCACRTLSSLGYVRYEVSNFARGGKISRHNSKYWYLVPYHGFGAGAHGFDGYRTRYWHSESVPEYIESKKIFSEKLTGKDVYNEYVILALRTERGIELADFIARFVKVYSKKIKTVIDNLISQGYLLNDGGYIKIPPEKMFVMNSIIEQMMVD